MQALTQCPQPVHEDDLTLYVVVEVPVTVTVHAAVLPLAFTVIVAVPLATPVTTPDELTVATDVLLLLQETDWSVALVGATVAFSVEVFPAARESVVYESETDVTATTEDETVTVQVEVMPLALTVITAVPFETAVTTPAELTVATEALLLVQVKDWSEASVGRMEATKVAVPPACNDMADDEQLTDSTAIAASLVVPSPTMGVSLLQAYPQVATIMINRKKKCLFFILSNYNVMRHSNLPNIVCTLL